MRPGEDVIGFVHLVESETMGDEPGRVEPACREHPQQHRGARRVDQARGDGDVADPEVFQMQGGGRTVDTDVGDVPAGTDQFRAQLEGLRHPDRFDRDVRAEASGEFGDRRGRVLAGLEEHVRAEVLRGGEPAGFLVDHDDGTRPEQLRRGDRGESDRPCPDDRDTVPGLDLSVAGTDLVGGRHDVGQHQRRLVRDPFRQHVGRGLGERDAHELRLHAVDPVTQDPATTAETLPVDGFPAVFAASARGDAGDEHAIAGLAGRHRLADFHDRADGLVPEDPAVLHGRDVAFEDVQIGAADGDRVHADDRVGRLGELRPGAIDPSPPPRAVVNQCLHAFSLSTEGFPVRACRRGGLRHRVESPCGPRRPTASTS
ncbi:dehydrogenase [Amycolatopsis decaplanina DSM 44594]|uniref:Dehydrogenase n=1 Tax=Amycolatopsis decaplanina DSM 44594 TaxID=1284240 RepID=M2YJZ6_9PSEU|nr:dehydrogenase [Amycolatopsis decaplanina DSM 44594]